MGLAFKGPATLKATPEGYEPQEEEYEKYYITRLLHPIFFTTEQQRHEIQLYEYVHHQIHTKAVHLKHEVIIN